MITQEEIKNAISYLERISNYSHDYKLSYGTQIDKHEVVVDRDEMGYIAMMLKQLNGSEM